VSWVTENNIPKDDAMPWRPNTARVGDGKIVENHQRVEVRGSRVDYYVNGNFLTSITSIFPFRVVGVSVSRQQRVAFVMLKITHR
jgi:hypothetical protein